MIDKKVPQKVVNIITLAAGAGTRLKLSAPKPLAPVAGRALVDFPIQAALQAAHQADLRPSLGVVVGHGRAAVEEHLRASFAPCDFAFQKEQKGTAHAVTTFFDQLPQAWSAPYSLILCSDTPLLRPSSLTDLIQQLQQQPQQQAIAATFTPNDPTGYGRIKRQGSGFSIIEHQDASAEERAIQEVNAGVYALRTDFLKTRLKEIGQQNAAGEFYLTDLFSPQLSVTAHMFDHPEDWRGVNDIGQLEQCELILRRRRVAQLREKAVRFLDSRHNLIDWDCQIGEGSLIYPYTVLEGKTQIGKGVTVESGCTIKDTIIEDAALIKSNSYLEKAWVKGQAQIGPMAHLRPQAEIGERAKVGNFVEIKKTKLANDVKVSHLSYLGDATVGARSNIGCGFISCNYDGAQKHLTTIGQDVFIGSDCQAIAPVTIGDQSFIAAGSTINQSIPQGSFAIARTRQITKEGLAKKFLK